MSMWEFEALAEMSVTMIAASDLSLAEKRNAYANAYAMVEGFDVSFVHFRSAKTLIAASFFHRIDVDQHPDYADHKDYFDAVVAAGESEWIKGPLADPDDYSPADGLYDPDPYGEGLKPGIWFDSTMPLWPRAAEAGLLTGLAAEPIELWPIKSTIIRFMTLAAEQGEAQYPLMKMLHGFVAYSLVYSDDVPKAGDETLAPVRDLPALKAALAKSHDDWIDERFDARTGMKHVDGDQKAFLEWWCEPYPG